MIEKLPWNCLPEQSTKTNVGCEICHFSTLGQKLSRLTPQGFSSSR